MLASLTIHRWQATLTDKKVTREVAEAHDVSQARAGKYRKFAINVEAPSFKATITAASELRHTHYWHTLPWGQDGARILTAANFDTYSRVIRQLREKFEQSAATFAADYPRLCESARAELNGLYSASDYPRDIGKRFGVDLSIMPLPDAADFRAQLSDGDVQSIRASIETELQKTTALAMRDPYERLYEHISRMVKALAEPKTVFRDTLVSGLADLCDVLPGLNLTGDARLDQLRAQAQDLISGVSAQTLREKPAVRAEVAAKATEIFDTMSAFMGEAS
jgi:hypothetical protein